VEAPVRWVKTHPMQSARRGGFRQSRLRGKTHPSGIGHTEDPHPIGWVLTHQNPPQASIGDSQSPHSIGWVLTHRTRRKLPSARPKALPSHRVGLDPPEPAASFHQQGPKLDWRVRTRVHTFSPDPQRRRVQRIVLACPRRQSRRSSLISLRRSASLMSETIFRRRSSQVAPMRPNKKPLTAPTTSAGLISSRT
jgi:hypothetical protein